MIVWACQTEGVISDIAFTTKELCEKAIKLSWSNAPGGIPPDAKAIEIRVYDHVEHL